MSHTNYDLFNPFFEFNYKIMIDNPQLENIENPHIQVLWEDNPENFTSDKIKNVKNFFQKKYGSSNVNVITKPKEINGEIFVDSSDITFDITDNNYQREIIKKYLDSRDISSLYDQVINIDDIINNKLISDNDEVSPFKKWIIKKIEFSNFLSYGDNQVLNFDDYNGIIAVQSDPSNFGGKSILTTDLLLFLFFNETTKSSKSIDIFNKFRDKNKVLVKGYIVIDGEEFIISRAIIRKKTKNGDWSVKNELDFFKVLSDGSLQNFTGEQRRETEEFIRTSIGSKEDFLMTILTNAKNLEELIDSKPTARGNILTRFLGLDFLKKKEEIGKEIFNAFSKGMLSNVYNTSDLQAQIEQGRSDITLLTKEIEELDSQIIDIEKRIKNGEEYKEELFNQKYTDIDSELLSLSVDDVKVQILRMEDEKNKIKQQIENIIIEVEKIYDEDSHDKILRNIMDIKVEIVNLEDKIKESEQLISEVENGITCDHCGIKLMDAKLTKEKIDNLGGFRDELVKKNSILSELLEQDNIFNDDKKKFDEIEKNKLIKEKLEISLETIDLKIEANNGKIDKFNDLQDKIIKNKEIDSKLIKANLLLNGLKSDLVKSNTDKKQKEVQIININKTIDQNYELIKNIEKEIEKEKNYRLYLDIFGKNGITKMIMKTMIPLINSELQRLLEDSSFFRLEIIINDKNEVEFYMVDNSTGISKPVDTGSGYEKTISSLALRSVLSKVCSLPKPNIIVFDEVFGKISNDNLDMVSEFFNKIKIYFEKIFIITHNPLILNWTDSVINIKKVDNISLIN